MSSTIAVRIKEKIRYDINIHREQNKQILLNSRRGVIIEDDDEIDVFTIKHMQNLALEIKSKKNITVKHLRVLKHALLNGQEFISEFYRVQGAIDSLLHYVSNKNEAVQLAAFECFCNISLGDKKTCIKLSKLITPYLMIYINNFNFNLSSMSIWILGNLSGSNEESCKLLQNQNFFDVLINCLKDSTCDEVILNAFYALKLFLKSYIYQLKVQELNTLLHICCERLNSWKESFWIVYQISCRQDCALLDTNLIKRLFHCLHQNEDIIDVKCLVSILRTFGNIISMDSSGYSANEFIIGLESEGSIIKTILIRNRQINLTDECAWLLGNVLNVLKVTDLNAYTCLVLNKFNNFCDYFCM